MSMSREPFTEQNANIASDIFLSKFGNLCTPYMMSIYFGSYITDYKSQFSSSFDLQDILKQFRDKFLPWWNSFCAEQEVQQTKNESDNQPVGIEGLRVWIKQKMADGIDIRTTNLYNLGFIKDDLIEEVINEPKNIF